MHEHVSLGGCELVLVGRSHLYVRVVGETGEGLVHGHIMAETVELVHEGGKVGEEEDGRDGDTG